MGVECVDACFSDAVLQYMLFNMMIDIRPGLHNEGELYLIEPLLHSSIQNVWRVFLVPYIKLSYVEINLNLFYEMHPWYTESFASRTDI